MPSQVATLAWRKQTALSWYARPAQARGPALKLLADLQDTNGIYKVQQELELVAHEYHQQQQQQQQQQQHLSEDQRMPQVDQAQQGDQKAEQPAAQQDLPGYNVWLGVPGKQAGRAGDRPPSSQHGPAAYAEEKRGGEQQLCKERAERKRNRSRSVSRSRSQEHGHRAPRLRPGTPGTHAAGHDDNQKRQQQAPGLPAPLLVPVLTPATPNKTESSWKLIGCNIIIRGMHPRTTHSQMKALFKREGVKGGKGVVLLLVWGSALASC
jgi:hypothetical protein